MGARLEPTCKLCGKSQLFRDFAVALETDDEAAYWLICRSCVLSMLASGELGEEARDHLERRTIETALDLREGAAGTETAAEIEALLRDAGWLAPESLPGDDTL